MLSRKFLAGACAAALSFALAGPASAKTLHGKAPMDGVTYDNPCTGETITLTGNLHVVASFDEELEIYTKQHINSQGISAVSDSGRVYTFVQSIQTITQPEADSANVLHITLNDRYVSRDGTENFVVHETLQIVYNANGEPTVFHTSGKLDCQG